MPIPAARDGAKDLIWGLIPDAASRVGEKLDKESLDIDGLDPWVEFPVPT
jgi:hypothetical protein